MEYVIFAVLDARLRNVSANWYKELFEVVYEAQPAYKPLAISLNYDILLDNVLFEVAEQRGDRARPAYGCDIQTEAYKQRKEYGRLLKLHGSLNWLYCASCRRLEIGMSKAGESVSTCKVVRELYRSQPLEDHYEGRRDAAPCKECSTPLRPVIITPTRTKDYRNPHIQGIWYQAERALRQAEHVCFVGYSLPDDDLEVIDLLRRGLGHLSAECITVVDYAPDDASHNSCGRHPGTPALRVRVRPRHRLGSMWVREVGRERRGMPSRPAVSRTRGRAGTTRSEPSRIGG